MSETNIEYHVYGPNEIPPMRRELRVTESHFSGMKEVSFEQNGETKLTIVRPLLRPLIDELNKIADRWDDDDARQDGTKPPFD